MADNSFGAGILDLDPSILANLPGLMGNLGTPNLGVLGPATAPGTAATTPMAATPAAQDQPQSPTNFWSQDNPDGTSSYLGGLFKYDPAKDIGRNDRLGLFGAAMADAGAQLAGHPEAATNLARYQQNYKQQLGQQALVQLLGGTGGTASAGTAAPAPASGRLADNAPASANVSATPAAPASPSLPGPSMASLPRLPASAAGAPAPTALQPSASGQPPQSFSLRAMAPQLATIAAAGGDVSPVLDVLKLAQPKYNPTVNYTKDNRPYLVGEDGSVDWLSPDITPREKVEVAGNGVAYDPYQTAPGTDFSDKDKPFNSATGAANPQVQSFEIHKATAGAQLRIDNQQNVDPKAVQVGVDYAMANGGKLPPTARSPTLQQAIMAGVGDRLQATGQTYDDLVHKGQDIHAAGATLTAFDKGKQGDQVRSLNVAVSHLGTLGKLADALNNGDSPAVNTIGNFFAQQTGKAAPTNFNTAKQLVGDEVTKAVVGAGGTGTDRDKAQKVIDAANSPAQLKGAIQTYQQMLGGQLRGLQQQYETSTGRKDFGDKLAPDTKAAIGWNPTPAPGNAPKNNTVSGNTSPINTAALPRITARVSSDADYAKLPSGTVFTGPDGVQRRKP